MAEEGIEQKAQRGVRIVLTALSTLWMNDVMIESYRVFPLFQRQASD